MRSLESIFDQLERCHTGLADLFPHEGTRAIGGSSIFIGTALFPALKSCFKSIRGELRKWTNLEARKELEPLLAAAEELLLRMEKGRKQDAELINKAAMLLYLANGTLWNYLRGFVHYEPPHDARYVRVEPMGPLLRRCGRETDREDRVDPKQVVQQICAELDACLR